MKKKTSGVLSCLGHSDCQPAGNTSQERNTFEVSQSSTEWKQKSSLFPGFLKLVREKKLANPSCKNSSTSLYFCASRRVCNIHALLFLPVFCNHRSLMEKPGAQFPHGAWDCLEQTAEALRDKVKIPHSILIRHQWTRATSNKLFLFILTRHTERGNLSQ